MGKPPALLPEEALRAGRGKWGRAALSALRWGGTLGGTAGPGRARGIRLWVRTRRHPATQTDRYVLE